MSSHVRRSHACAKITVDPNSENIRKKSFFDEFESLLRSIILRETNQQCRRRLLPLAWPLALVRASSPPSMRRPPAPSPARAYVFDHVVFFITTFIRFGRSPSHIIHMGLSQSSFLPRLVINYHRCSIACISSNLNL
jgi:hypothetical protein